MVTLGPPCDFVSANGVDALALQCYRKANALYRLGSPHGSKGELASLPELVSRGCLFGVGGGGVLGRGWASCVASREWPLV